MTDSGGVQEEACILKVPCITLRTSTERPETLKIRANILMGENLLKDFNKMIHKKILINPYGNGNSAEEIIKSLKSFY